jgi:hypothetical protein
MFTLFFVSIALLHSACNYGMENVEKKFSVLRLDTLGMTNYQLEFEDSSRLVATRYPDGECKAWYLLPKEKDEPYKKFEMSPELFSVLELLEKEKSH